MTKELTEDEFKSTFGEEMLDMTEKEIDPIDIWPYVKELKDQNLITTKTYESEIVDYVYRDNNDSFDHVLIPTDRENKYIAVIVDLHKKSIYGHYHLDLNKEYGMG